MAFKKISNNIDYYPYITEITITVDDDTLRFFAFLVKYIIYDSMTGFENYNFVTYSENILFRTNEVFLQTLDKLNVQKITYKTLKYITHLIN